MQNINEQIQEVENELAIKRRAIARMEEAIERFGTEPSDWYRGCSFNLKKAKLAKETLEKKLLKLLNTQKELAKQEQAALLRENRRQLNHELEVKRAELAGIAKKKNAEHRQLKTIEQAERKCVELRRLIAAVVGDEQSYAMSEQAEKLAKEWMDKRTETAAATK